MCRSITIRKYGENDTRTSSVHIIVTDLPLVLICFPVFCFLLQFHLMEKANEEALTARQRMASCTPLSAQRACSTRGNSQSFSAQDSPILGAAAGANSLSHSTSLEFGHAKFVPPKHACVIAEGHAVDEFHNITTAVPKIMSTVTACTVRPQPLGSEELTQGEKTKIPESVSTHLSISLSPPLRTAQLFSPVPIRRAQMVSFDGVQSGGGGAPQGTTSPVSFRSRLPGLESTVEGGSEESDLPKSPLSLDQSFGLLETGDAQPTVDQPNSGNFTRIIIRGGFSLGLDSVMLHMSIMPSSAFILPRKTI